MPLKLMYITNDPEIAQIAESAGVDRIFVDLEYIGKSDRQGGMDTVQSRHTVDDVARLRKIINKAELMVRCNPIHDATSEYPSSKEEIDAIIDCGADLIMLPYFKTVSEAKTFVEAVDGRAKTMLLVETPEAVAEIDDILSLEGIDEVYIGLNDLSIGYGKKFMFEHLVDGSVEMLSEKFNSKGLPFGFGGVASMGKGLLPAEYVICEHYRLGSVSAILSRSFCDANRVTDIETVRDIFTNGIRDIRKYENKCAGFDSEDFMRNKVEIERIVKQIIEK